MDNLSERGKKDIQKDKIKVKRSIFLQQFDYYYFSLLMQSSGSEFPREDLVTCLRQNGKGKEGFVKQAKKLNIQWIYEIVKYCYNVLFEEKQKPDCKLTALLLIKDLLETCEVPSVHLIEVYILPVIYKMAIYNPNERGDKRGRFFFQNNGYSARLPNIQQNGIKFLALCTEMVYFGSLVKTRRSFQNEQLKQVSEFEEYYQNLKKYGIDQTPISPRQLKFFNQKLARSANQTYLKKLSEFDKHSEAYGDFFIQKIIDSLESQQNILFNTAGKTVSSLNNDLDMRKLLKYGDTYITSPLLQNLSQGLKVAQNFIIKRNFLSLISDFVKWADVESFVLICFEETFDTISIKIADVHGQKGLGQGENIYPQIKGQRDAKKKFYLQFLKGLQIWARCITGDLFDEEEPSKAEQYYQFFKVERRFVFPENLMSKRIQADFAKCQEYNEQRNERILNRMRDTKSSIIQARKSISLNKQSLMNAKNINNEKITSKKQTFLQIESRFDECFNDFITLTDEQELLDQKMQNLKHFRQNFDEDINNMEEDNERPFQEFQVLLDSGDDLIQQIVKAEQLENQYKKKNISFRQFKQKFEALLLEMENNNEEDEGSSRNSPKEVSVQIPASVKSNKKNQNKSFGKVTTSYAPVIPSEVSSRNPYEDSPYFQKNVIQNEDKQKFMKKPLKKLKNSERSSQISEQNSRFRRRSSKLGSKIKKEQVINTNESHPYYNAQCGAQDSRLSASKLSRLENKSISSEMSSYKQKMMKRKSFISDRVSIVDDKIVENFQDKNPNLKKKISQHRASRVSDNSKVNSSLYKSNKISKISNSFAYEIKQPSAVQKFTDEEPFSGSEVSIPKYHGKDSAENQIYPIAAKNQYPMKGNTENLGFKKSNFSNMKSLRRSNSQISSDVDRNIKRLNLYKDNYPKGDNYFITAQLKQFKSKISRFSQRSSKRPSSSHSQSKVRIGHSKQKLLVQKQYERRPQTSSGFKNEEYNDHYQMKRSSNNKSDKIIPPDDRPIQKSYYGIEQIGAQVKRSNKMQFKNCLQLQKQVIHMTKKKQNQLLKGINNDLMRKGRSTNQSSSFEEMNINKNPQEEYLMMKLRREHNMEQNDELKKIQGRILNLKSQTSKIRSDLTSRSEDNRDLSLRRSLSGRSNDHCTFQISKRSHNSSSQSLSKDRSGLNKNSNISVSGFIFNEKLYYRYFCEIRDENIKKTFLRSKTILLKNQNLEVGSVFKRSQGKLKITLYVTPQVQIQNFKITVPRQHDMDIKVSPEAFSEVPKGQQVRVVVEIQLKSVPYSIPTMYMKFQKNGKTQRPQNKSYSFYLPCSLHRFVEFHGINYRKDLMSKFDNSEKTVIKTAEFRVSRRVAKIENIQQYFPKITVMEVNGDTQKFAAECSLLKQKFIFMITTRRPQNMVIQGLALTRPQLLEYFLSFLKHIFTMDPLQ